VNHFSFLAFAWHWQSVSRPCSEEPCDVDAHLDHEDAEDGLLPFLQKTAEWHFPEDAEQEGKCEDGYAYP